MQLSKRLKAVVDNVTRGNRVADIGCDHAYISIYLIEHKIASKVIAMDINKGPLQMAKNNIKKYGYQNQIETRLSDGAKELKIGEVDSLIIAGMGGNLTKKILEESKEIVQDIKELVLQPQSEIPIVRQYLHNIGYQITTENMLLDEGKYYVMMRAVKGQELYEEKEHYLFGKLLLEQNNQILKEYLENGCKNYEEIIQKLDATTSEKAKNRVEELKHELDYIKRGLKYFDL